MLENVFFFVMGIAFAFVMLSVVCYFAYNAADPRRRRRRQGNSGISGEVDSAMVDCRHGGY